MTKHLAEQRDVISTIDGRNKRAWRYKDIWAYLPYLVHAIAEVMGVVGHKVPQLGIVILHLQVTVSIHGVTPGVHKDNQVFNGYFKTAMLI